MYVVVVGTHNKDVMYSKTCLKRPLKIDKTNVWTTNGSLMKVESSANAQLLTCIKR